MNGSEVVLLRCGDCNASFPVPKRLMNLGSVRPCPMCTTSVKLADSSRQPESPVAAPGQSAISHSMGSNSPITSSGLYRRLAIGGSAIAVTGLMAYLCMGYLGTKNALSGAANVRDQNDLNPATEKSSTATAKTPQPNGTPPATVKGLNQQSAPFPEDVRTVCQMISADYTDGMTLTGPLSNSEIAKHIVAARIRHAGLNLLAERNPGPIGSLATELASSSRRLDVLYNTIAPPDSVNGLSDIGQALESRSSDFAALALVQLQRMEYFRETQELVPELLTWLESHSSTNRFTEGVEISIEENDIKILNRTSYDLSNSLVYLRFFQHSKSDTTSTMFVEKLLPGQTVSFSGYLADAQFCAFADCRVVGWNASSGEFSVASPSRVSVTRDRLFTRIQEAIGEKDVREAEYSLKKLKGLLARFPHKADEQRLATITQDFARLQTGMAEPTDKPNPGLGSGKSVPQSEPHRSPVDPNAMKGLDDQELFYVSGRNLIKRIRFGSESSEITLEDDGELPVLASRPSKRSVYYASAKTLWLFIYQGEQSNPVEVRKFGRTVLALSVHPKEDRLAWTQVKPETHPDLILGTFRDSKETNLGSGYDPQWTADGKLLLFTGVNPDWFVGVRQGTSLKKLDVPYHRLIHMYPTSSPDQSKIVYSLPGKDGTLQLGIITEDENVYQWTDDGDFNSWAMFSPDGRFVAYIRGREYPCELRVKSLVNGNESIVAKDCSPARPVWIVSEKVFKEQAPKP